MPRESPAKISHWQRIAELKHLQQVGNEKVPGQDAAKEEDCAGGLERSISN